MKFFLLWIMTRLKEEGWPKAQGLLRRRKVITEEAVIAATQGAIRIAITIGGSLPDVARAIAITCMDTSDEPLTQKAVEKWIDKAATMGDEKMTNLSDIYPEWLRFCSITAVSSNGDFQYFLWRGTHEEYDTEDPILIKMYSQSTALAGIVMCWAYRHPDKAENLFNNPDAIRYLTEGLPPKEAVTPELQGSVSGPAIYSAWLHMAEMLVSRYSEEVGFPKYEDLA